MPIEAPFTLSPPASPSSPASSSASSTSDESGGRRASANSLGRIKSFVNGLSDFWLLYFKEIDQLEVFYTGTEILVGQTYLDLMSLLLNNSLQDTSIFNKEFFKLLIVSETDLRFRADKYVYELPDNVVFTRHLNNKILTATAALDKDVDFYLDEDTRALEFLVDPTNAYRESTFGSGNSQFRVRSKISPGSNIRVHLNDTGGALSIAVAGYDVTITYDGPAFTATSTATQIVQALNTHVLTKELLFSEVTGLGTGTSAPAGTLSLEALSKVSRNALDGFATRQQEFAFAAKLSTATISDWVAEGVEKGDILRILGDREELEVNLVRKDALYLGVGETTALSGSAKTDFVVLREPENATSVNEPFANSGVVVQSGVDGTITASTRELTSPTAVFVPVHEGDLIEVIGASNVGAFTILEVVDPNTVVLASNGLIDETPVTWHHHSVVDATNIGADGVFVNNADGTANFTAASAVFVVSHVGAVLKIHRGGAVETFDILEYVSSTEIVVNADDTAADGAALDWGTASVYTGSQVVAYSPPVGWLKEGTVTVTARRLVDNQAVLEGRDYTVNADSSTITPITVWRASVTNTVSYDYRLAVVENVTPLQTGVDGTITPGSPNTFTSPTAVFTSKHVGYAIKISGSGLVGATNNGEHYIAAVLSSTTVELTTDKRVPSTLDPTNGFLGWQLLRRGALTTTGITAFVEQTSFWVPDALVDRFHLYNTFGYLINKFERSSEAYRSLIRGIFQLFMLGPTLERFESAVNTVAGLPVIRDNGEILIAYDNGALQAGADGFFDFATKTFTAVSAAFTADSAADYIVAIDGYNVNRLFRIATVTDANTVVLDEAPVTDGPISWELTDTAEHTVTTSRTTYTFDRNISIRSEITDSSNVGVKIFQAFEVLTDVFSVTDYIESPTWFESVQIPEELAPNLPAERRQSTPALFENVVSPADDGRIGDPGFIIGADSEGFKPLQILVRNDGGAADGTLIRDPHYPFTNDVRFTSPTGNFTSADVGNLLLPTFGEYRILAIVSPTEVQLEAFHDVEDLTGLSWDIVSSPLVKRHKAAFVILNQYLKYHLFSVEFDSTLLGQLSAALLADLQELVFVAKPSYTYIVLSPTALFQEILNVGEDLEYGIEMHLGGSEGSIIAANTNPLTVIGSSWRIGNWFRYRENTATFAAPAVEVTDALGVPDAGYIHYLNKAFITPTDFTSNAAPIQVADLVFGASAVLSGIGSLSVSNVAGVVTATVASGPFNDNHLLTTLRLSGSGAANDGDYTIGSIIDSTTVVIYGPAVTAESGLDWELHSTGGVQGAVQVASNGVVEFVDLTGTHVFDATHVGDYIRFPFVTNLANQTFRIDEVVSTYRVRFADWNRVDPIEGDPDATGDVTSGILTVSGGAVIFSPSMASGPDAYYVSVTSGPDTGSKFLITAYIAPDQAEVSGITDGVGISFYVEVKRYPSAVNEVTTWEHVRENIKLSGGNIDISTTPAQDIAATVKYTAYGVREPIDPTAEVFDETAGDTLYSIGMLDPRQKRGKSRTGKDTDMREEPLQITRT